MKRSSVVAIATLIALIGCANQSTIKDVAVLKNADNVLDKAKDEGAKKYAPQTLELAEKTLQDAAKTIRNNRDTDAVTQAANEATRQAKRTLSITRESKRLSEMKPEQIALREESRALALSAQTKEVASLEQLSQLNQRFNEASKAFTEEEADVFRKGNDLVIRLKAISFPSGGSQIPTSRYALLNKVQKVIRDYGQPEVTVEGHSDSVGAPEANKTLSQERAESVREYLVANEALPAERIKAVGVGADRPIASNTTREGRAENRRIDLVINVGEVDSAR